MTNLENHKTEARPTVLPRIRNLKEAYQEILIVDPATSISYFAFRRDIMTGAIPSRKNGNRYYINMSDVESYYG